MDKPRSRALSVLHNWFQGDSAHSHNVHKLRPVLSGLAESRLDESRDLVALRRPTDKDILTRFLQDHWMFKVPLSDGWLLQVLHTDRVPGNFD